MVLRAKTSIIFYAGRGVTPIILQYNGLTLPLLEESLPKHSYSMHSTFHFPTPKRQCQASHLHFGTNTLSSGRPRWISQQVTRSTVMESRGIFSRVNETY